MAFVDTMSFTESKLDFFYFIFLHFLNKCKHYAVNTDEQLT